MRRRKEQTAASFAAILPVAAGLAFVSVSPTRVAADGVVCYYAGQQYSQGACIRSVCEPPQSQRCSAEGTWSACSSCSEPEEG